MRKAFLPLLIALLAPLMMAGDYVPDQLSHTDQTKVTIETWDNISRDLGPERPYVDDAVPRFAVEFDDGRLIPYSTGQIQAFGRRGLPVTLAINASSIGTGGNHLSWNQIRDLINHFENRWNSKLEIANHSYNNMNGVAPAAMGYKTLVTEFDSTPIVAELGIKYRPKLFVLPGDGNIYPWARRHKDAMIALLDSLGYSYANMSASGQRDSSVIASHVPSVVVQSQQATVNYATYFTRPGYNREPLWMFTGVDLDLGNYVVERKGGVSSRGTTGWLMGSGTGGQHPLRLLGTNNAGVQWDNTFAFVLYQLLGNNMGCRFVMHDSVQTCGGTFGGATGDSTAGNVIGLADASITNQGHFSPDYIAYTLYELQKQGMLLVVTSSEFYEWALSRYKPGTDLINNPGCIVPQFAINDTAGVHYLWPQGFGANGRSTGTWAAGTTAQSTTHTGFSLSGKFNLLAADSPTTLIGPTVTGYLGRKGGYKFPTATNKTLNFEFAQLPPGRYRFSFPTNNNTFSGAFNAKAFNLSCAVKFIRSSIGWDNGGALAYGDTLLTWREWSTTLAFVQHEPAGIWSIRGMEFLVPNELPEWTPIVEATNTYAVPSLATATNTRTSILVIGAKVGDIAQVSYSTDLKGDIMTSYVAIADTAYVVVSNQTAGTVAPDAGTMRVRVLRPMILPQAIFKQIVATNDWSATWSMNGNGLGTAQTLSCPRLIYQGPQ